MKKEKAKNFIFKIWKEWRKTIFFIVFILIPVKSSVADWNWVPSGSMNPAILEGDLLYINKLAYSIRLPLTLCRLAEWSEPNRGNIVICFSPEDGTRLVKRVIGKPGDTIELKNNRLFLNGQPAGYKKFDSKYTEYLSCKLKNRAVLATEYLDDATHVIMSMPLIAAIRDFGPVKVPQDSYFVMGDNRDNSRDSRFFGFVPKKQIIGKAEGIIVSFDITDKFQPRLKRFFSSLK